MPTNTGLLNRSGRVVDLRERTTYIVDEPLTSSCETHSRGVPFKKRNTKPILNRAYSPAYG